MDFRISDLFQVVKLYTFNKTGYLTVYLLPSDLFFVILAIEHYN